MPSPVLRRFLAPRAWFVLAAPAVFATTLAAQVPTGQQLPSPEQAQEMLRTQPELVQ